MLEQQYSLSNLSNKREKENMIKCRCCNNQVFNTDKYPIHTKCIVKHWDKHAKGISNSRCYEFKNK